jgi:ABC-type nitrate/sulfonate/bicarbonate transport system substrate-binding protein
MGNLLSVQSRQGGEIMRRLLTASLVFALALALGAPRPARAEGPVKIRVAWVAIVSNLPSILFIKPGIARHEGKSYAFEPLHFGSTPLMIPALATNEIEVATLAYSSLGSTIEKKAVSDIRVIADEFQDGAPGYYSDEFMVRKDSPIHSIADLKGKVIATSGIGGAMDMAMRVMLKKNGFDPKTFTIVEVSMPNHRAALMDKKVDLISSPLPFSEDPALRANARTLFTQKEAIGLTQMIIWAAREPFIKAHRAALVDFLEDTIRARRYFADPANHDEVVKLVSAFTKQPANHYASWLFTKRDYYRNPNDKPDLGALQRNLDVQHELGFLKDRIDIKQYSDLTLVEEADARVK